MKAILCIFAVVQILYCCGEPCGNSTFVRNALNATVTEVNKNFTINHLLAVTSCKVLNITNYDEGFYYVDLEIDVQETTCLKASGKDPANCSLKTTPGAKTAHCTSWVRLMRELSECVKLVCREAILTTSIAPEPTMITQSTAMKMPASTSMWIWSIMMVFYKILEGI
ncbi:secreted phosphoprotein 24-like [Cetorhinus maximus]